MNYLLFIFFSTFLFIEINRLIRSYKSNNKVNYLNIVGIVLMIVCISILLYFNFS